jgi:hypothetical protein
MTPVQSWGLVIALIVIVLLFRDGLKKRKYGSAREIVRQRKETDDTETLRACNILDSVELIQVLRRSGYEGHFWNRRTGIRETIANDDIAVLSELPSKTGKEIVTRFKLKNRGSDHTASTIAEQINRGATLTIKRSDLCQP